MKLFYLRTKSHASLLCHLTSGHCSKWARAGALPTWVRSKVEGSLLNCDPSVVHKVDADLTSEGVQLKAGIGVVVEEEVKLR